MRRQEPSEQFARFANGISLGDVAKVWCALLEIIRLGLSTADPADGLERSKRGRAGRWIGCLAVVDEEDAGHLADALHPVREARKGTKTKLDLALPYPQSPACRDRGGRVLGIVRPLESGPMLLVQGVIPNHQDCPLFGISQSVLTGVVTELIFTCENGDVLGRLHFKQPQL